MMTTALYPVCPRCSSDDLKSSLTLIECSSSDVYHPARPESFLCQTCSHIFHDREAKHVPRPFELTQSVIARSIGLIGDRCTACGGTGGKYYCESVAYCLACYPGEVLDPEGRSLKERHRDALWYVEAQRRAKSRKEGGEQ